MNKNSKHHLGAIAIEHPNNNYKIRKVRVSVTIDSDIKEKLSIIGKQYGLGLSHMIERSVRCYIQEIENIRITYERAQDFQFKKRRNNDANRTTTTTENKDQNHGGIP